MAPTRPSKPLVSRRRRVGRESDDEDSVTMGEDSHSEGSVSEAGDEADDSDTSEVGTSETRRADAGDAQLNGPAKVDGGAERARKSTDSEPTNPSLATDAQPVFETSADTVVMMNGLKDSDDAGQETAVSFDEMGDKNAKPETAAREPTQAPSERPETLADRRRREHEEYKKKRESDPTFIPNRGGFFMHDSRTPDQRGFLAGRGRGRGRGFAGSSFPPANQTGPPAKAEDSPWAHDLHETLDEPNGRPLLSNARAANIPNVMPFLNAQAAAAPVAASNLRSMNFSTSKLLGNAQVRVLLPGMKAPVPFTAVPIKQHTRLPDHRPSLRRDKPVRISLPDRAPRYIFPSQDRSFIFIPRALRPNQQGFGRTRGSFGYASSRRTSAYGGSIYSPSIAASRRSSIARDREPTFSPSELVMYHAGMQPGRPVVRLPHGVPYPNAAMSPGGSFAGQAMQSYPLPQTPVVEHYRETSTMHQPRPQKTISVSGIESPALLALHAPRQQSQQPFQNQLPQHMTEAGAASQSAPSEAAPPGYYPYAGQPSTGTPLSNIPERAIHAQPFQPPTQGFGQPFYPPFASQGLYYPQSNPQYPPMPIFMPPQPSYTGNAPHQSAASETADQQGGLVAHEQNGMVYYLDASQVPQYPPQPYQGQEGFLQSYAVPGAGGMLTPSPEAGYYYPPGPAGPVYYPQAQ